MSLEKYLFRPSTYFFRGVVCFLILSWLSSHFSVVSFAVKWPLSLIVVILAPLFIGFPRQQEYWSGVPFPSPGDLPDPGIELASPAWKAYFFIFFQVDSLPLS